jgi:hypothetical protein
VRFWWIRFGPIFAGEIGGEDGVNDGGPLRVSYLDESMVLVDGTETANAIPPARTYAHVLINENIPATTRHLQLDLILRANAGGSTLPFADDCEASIAYQYGFASRRQRSAWDAALSVICELGPKPYAIVGRDRNDTTDRRALGHKSHRHLALDEAPRLHVVHTVTGGMQAGCCGGPREPCNPAASPPAPRQRPARGSMRSRLRPRAPARSSRGSRGDPAADAPAATRGRWAWFGSRG